MKLKIRIFLLIAAGLSVIFLVVGAVQAKYQEKRLTNELRIKAGSVAEITGISAGILINENTGNKLKELTAGFENNKRSQGCIIYDASGLVAASSRSFEGIGNSDSGLAKTVITSGVPEYFQVYNGGLMVLKYIAPVKNRTNSTGAVEVIYDMSYIKSGIYKSWVRLGIIALCLILLRKLFFCLKRNLMK
jgi:sensor histidine kinase regulating citrate/malate metabolism